MDLYDTLLQVYGPPMHFTLKISSWSWHSDLSSSCYLFPYTIILINIFQIFPGQGAYELMLVLVSRYCATCVYCRRRSQERKSKIYFERYVRPSRSEANKLPWICRGTKCISKTDIKARISFKIHWADALKDLCYKYTSLNQWGGFFSVV